AEGEGAARRLAAETAAVMAAWLTLLSLAGVLFMPAVVWALAPGFAALPAKFALAVRLGRITFPYLMLICLAALLGGMLNGIGRFGPAAAAPVLFNVCMIAALLGLSPLVGGPAYALAWGVTVSGMAQLALLAAAAAAAGWGLRLSWPRVTPGVRLVFRRMVPGLVGAGVTQINLAVDVIIASLLPAGSVSVLYYADRVNQLPLGVIGAAVGTALLPTLARQLRLGEAQAARASLNRAIELSALLTLPAAAALISEPGPVIAVLFGRGAFGAEDVLRSAAALVAYAAGLPAFVLVKVLAPGFFARGDTRTPVLIALAAMVLNIGFNLALMGPLAQVGVALATTLAAWVNAASLAAMLFRRGYWRPDARLAARLWRMAAAGLAMAAGLRLAEAAGLAGLIATPGLRWAGLAALVGLGFALYGGIGQGLRAFDWREVRAGLRPAGTGGG
ncbi:MAG: murein biosynthesis integral membrane protein MurJ, partial [Acetobacteraceae bacterium]